MTEAIVIWFLITAPVDMNQAKFVSQHKTQAECHQEQLNHFFAGGEHAVCHKLVLVEASKPRKKK